MASSILITESIAQKRGAYDLRCWFNIDLADCIYISYSIFVAFEWDSEKNRASLSKHGISFEEAVEIFSGPIFTAEDKRKDYGEKRMISIGALSGIAVLLVAHVDREGKTRIISARKANEKERGLFYDYLKKKA